MIARELPPLSLYLHMPWCVRKCPYCDFNSHTAGPNLPKDRYVDALIADLETEARSSRAASRPFRSIFIGGGTPSLFSGPQIGRVLDAVRALFDVLSDAEVTMEANPGTVECIDLPGYRTAGVNRLSIGAQSFDPAILQALGRIHGPAAIVKSFEAARDAGFGRINLDLMFALPGQDLRLAQADIEQALALGPSHISYYQLTLEPNTVFYTKPPANLPDEEVAWDIQQLGQQMLQSAGFEQYEISAFAKPGQQCVHNLNYWHFGDYLGVGAGAHGKFTSPEGAVWRYSKPAHPIAYMEQAENRQFRSGASAVTNAELGFEYLLNVLRLPEGLSETHLRQRTGLRLDALRPQLERAEDRGLIASCNGKDWKPTALGWRFLNDLQAEFLPG